MLFFCLVSILADFEVACGLLSLPAKIPSSTTQAIMTASQERLSASARGRVCLLGEHQDVLDLPVIPCAICRRITISGHRADGKPSKLALPEVHAEIALAIKDGVPYRGARDYFRGTVNVLQRAGFTFSCDFHGLVRGDIPFNSGISSLSALVGAGVNLLAHMSDQ